MIKWFKTLFRIVRDYDNSISELEGQLYEVGREASYAVGIARSAEEVIRERTEIDVDLHYRSIAPSQVIVVGKYRGHDYVQAFGFDHDDLESLIRQLKEMERYGQIRRVDAPYEIRGFMEHEFLDLRD